MNVNLISPISITVTSAKLVVEDSGTGTIELTILGQPVRLNILSTDYTYDINIAIGDRVQLTSDFGAFHTGSSGIVQKIIPDYTQDTIMVLFDTIFPDQVINPVDANVILSAVSLLVQVPLNIVQKI